MHNYLVKKNNKLAWLLLGPFAVYFIIFLGFPTGFALILGFLDWVGVDSKPRFAGINNFIRFFTDETYLKVLANSFLIGSLLMIINVTCGLLGALLLNSKIKGRTLFRSIWYLPAVTSYIATSQIFLMFLDPGVGIANNILKNLGITPITWGYSVFWMIAWILFYGAWKGIGVSMILWLAGLQGIDRTLYEQAAIDGANKWQLFRYITLPLLRPISVFVLITQFREAIQIFEPVLFISKGGPFGKTQVLVSRVFLDFYSDFNFGMAGAGALVTTTIVVAFSYFVFRWYGSKGEGNA